MSREGLPRRLHGLTTTNRLVGSTLAPSPPAVKPASLGILGLGKNVPIAMGNLSDSIMAPVDGKFITLRMPYPSGFFPKNVDGRIDDPNVGWKGRGI